MKSKTYPFLHNQRKPPNNSFIICEAFGASMSKIEYDTEIILKVLENKNPIENFSDFPKINKEQLQRLLGVTTRYIVEIEIDIEK